MKTKTLKYIVCVLVATMPLCSCQKEFKYMHAGDDIRFTAGSGFAQTKASYSGATNSAGTIERIDWQEGDLLRIYCARASDPAQKFADYKVTSVDTPVSGSEISTAYIETFSEATDGVGLRWGEGDHDFYGVFPSPAAEGVTTSISGSEVSASIPAVQGIAGEITKSGSNWTASPDLKNMLMTAKAGPYTAETFPDEDHVFLSFTPLTTAIEFTIKNVTGSELDLTSVHLVSGNGKSTAEPVLCGGFSVDIDQSGITAGTEVQPFAGNSFKITYQSDYPECSSVASTSTDQDIDRTLTINVGTASAPLALAVDETFTFTFFLNPIHDFNDLTFKFCKADGSWMMTRLCYIDGDGIFFPRHKKSFVTGLLIPEGAQWTVKYGPLVTSWDSGVDGDLDMGESLYEFIDLGLPSGTKWSKINIGAAAESGAQSYGNHYAWGELSTKTTYSLASYRWPSFGKYNGTDGLNSLELEDDIAHQQLGGRRHIPTREQFEELFNSAYTTSVWVDNYQGNGVGGYVVTSKSNSNYIFLPAAGLTNDTDGLVLRGIHGCYWSSTLNATPDPVNYPYPSCAIDVDFSNVDNPLIYVANDDSRRLLGESVRPVEDPVILSH